MTLYKDSGKRANTIEDILQEEREYRIKSSKVNYGAYITAMEVIASIESRLADMRTRLSK
jgi:hypothetical protein